MHGPPQGITNPPKREKVYCGNCVYLKWYGKYACHHPSNMKRKENWHGVSTTVKYKSKPQKINKKNTCLHFEKMKTGGGKKLL
jgi:hypothetical protein